MTRIAVAAAERRNGARRSLPLPATIQPAAGGQITQTHSLDVSVHGVLLSCVGITGDVVVGLTVPGIGRLRLAGYVARREAGRTAVRFTELTPADREHLAMLVCG